MPYKVVAAKGGGYDIIRTDTHKVVGHSDTLSKAQASVRIRKEKSGEEPEDEKES